MMELIETYVNSIVNAINVSKTKQQRIIALTPFPEEDILAVFKDPSSPGVMECCDRTSSQMLLLMYSLVYQHELLAKMKTLCKVSYKRILFWVKIQSQCS